MLQAVSIFLSSALHSITHSDGLLACTDHEWSKIYNRARTRVYSGNGGRTGGAARTRANEVTEQMDISGELRDHALDLLLEDDQKEGRNRIPLNFIDSNP